MTFAVSQSITTLCRCCVTVLEQCFTVTACIFATWLGARCVCELFRRARWRRPRTMPFPTEFPAAPYITREVDSEGRLISRMKQYDENNPSPRNLRERYRDHTSRRRERASGTVSCLYSRRATFGQAMAMVALVVSATTSKFCQTCITAQGDISPYIGARVNYQFAPSMHVDHMGGRGSAINKKQAFFNFLAPSLPSVRRDKFLDLASVSVPLKSKGVSD